jgi:hypothetical protein
MAARKKVDARPRAFKATMAAKKHPARSREQPRAVASSRRPGSVEALMINGKPYGIDEAMCGLKLRAMR